MAPVDPFDPDVGRGAAWKLSTREAMASGYGRWLHWLSGQGELAAVLSPGERVTRERMRDYLQTLKAQGLADYSVAGRVKQVGRVLQMIDPGEDWTWIVRAGDRLHAKATPSRDRLSVMRPPEEVLQLGLDLMQAAEDDRFRTACDRATLFRDGLLLAFLVQRPFRRANLTNLTLGVDLERRDGWQMRIEDEETKTGSPIFCPWPENLIGPLERYLALHRETLRRGAETPIDTAALWISRQGGAMSAGAIARQVKHRTQEEFGKGINPHTFRSIAATAIATFTPSESGAILDVLGHQSLRTSERFYNRAQTLSAGEHFHDSLNALRGSA